MTMSHLVELVLERRAVETHFLNVSVVQVRRQVKFSPKPHDFQSGQVKSLLTSFLGSAGVSLIKYILT